MTNNYYSFIMNAYEKGAGDIGVQDSDSCPKVVDGENVAPSPTFTFENIDSDHSIRPIFSVYRYQITASAGMGGTVTPVTTTISHGSDATVSITPNDCYHLDSLIVDGQIVDSKRMILTN